MILPRTTSCNVIEIRAPRWKQRVVGIANFRVGTHNAIDITAVGKDGKRYYPETLYGSGEMITKCEMQTLPSGVKLYLVPIGNLEPLEREGDVKPIIKVTEDKKSEPITTQNSSLFSEQETEKLTTRKPSGYDFGR